MYYPCSENKGADQLRGYREADLRLCFRICRLLVFPRGGSYHRKFYTCFFFFYYLKYFSFLFPTCNHSNFKALSIFVVLQHFFSMFCDLVRNHVSRFVHETAHFMHYRIADADYHFHHIPSNQISTEL